MMFTAMQAMLEYVSCLSDVYRFVYPVCVCVCVQAVPKPIAMEPCWGSRAGVLTVLLYLPRVPSGIPPPGQSGMIHTNTHEQTSKRHIECVYRERITACNCLIFANPCQNFQPNHFRRLAIYQRHRYIGRAIAHFLFISIVLNLFLAIISLNYFCSVVFVRRDCLLI